MVTTSRAARLIHYRGSMPAAPGACNSLPLGVNSAAGEEAMPPLGETNFLTNCDKQKAAPV
jgi:hypothetical protein